MAKDIRQTKVLKQNNKSFKTQQRAGHTIQWPKI